METLVTLERDRRDLVGKAKAIGEKGTLGESEITELTEIRSKVEALDTSIKSAKWIDTLEQQEASQEIKTEDQAERSWETQARKFSICKAIAAQLPGSRVDAGLETEVSAELAVRSGRSYEGIAVPMLALEKRVLQAESTTGQNIQTDDYRPGDFIPLLRDALVTNKLGVRVLRGLSGDVKIPKAATSITSTWQTEQGDLSVADPTFAAPITMTPHKMGTIGEWSAQLMIQANPDIEGLIRSDIVESLARVIDGVILLGGRSNEPDGIIASTARNSRSGDTNGKALTLAEIYNLMGSLDDENVGTDSRSFLLRNSVKRWLQQQVKFASTDSVTLWHDGGVLGEPTVVSNIVPQITRGTGSDLDTLMYGNWSDLIVGYWQDLDLLVNPYAASAYSKGNIQLRAMLFVDVAIRHQQAFRYYDGVVLT